MESGHPERPERIEAIKSALVSIGWWDQFTQIRPVSISDDILFSIHDPSYVRLLKSVSARGGYLDADTYTTSDSWQLALNSIGGAIGLASSVWNSKVGYIGDSSEIKYAIPGIALTRPPGHHAKKDRGMGFCLLNNIAFAAEYLIRYEGAARIAIVDLDLHHGNGTQDIFWYRDDVFYISTHQFPYYPGTGNFDEIGSGAGEGYTANFPLPPGTGDEGFSATMKQLVLPLLENYRPEMILISFGFDPHWKDPLGHLLLSASGYGLIVHALKELADKICSGKIALFLEGGYDLEAGIVCTQSVISACLGIPFDDYLGYSPRTEGKSWESYLRKSREIWRL